jgi:predicted unusual protein kinase regulating ubiquinone biosynthesis (AarF/ABC1/UbiB family)
VASDADRPAKRPSSRGRALQIGSLSATVAGSYLGGTLRRLFLPAAARDADRAETHRRNAARILEVAGRLKGGVMKAMQLLSYQGELLPGEYVDILSGLQDQAPPMAPGEAEAQIERDLGAPPGVFFARFDPTPAAAASLGQVHRAVLRDGRPVAVKVQYPGIADEVAADLRLLRRSLAAQKIAGADLLRQSGLDHRHLHDDIAARLAEELDYRREALHLRVFREMYRGRDDVRVPDVIEDLTGEHVLTMDWIDGYPIRDILNEGADYALRERTVRVLDWMSLQEVLGVGITHADPHPGNYLVTADGLALLDLGCVKLIDDERLGHYRNLVRALLGGDRDLLVASLEGVGQIAPGQDPAPAIAFTEFMYLPMLRDEPWDGRALDFPAELSKRLAALLRARYFAFPTDTVFLMRKFIGMAAVFRGLRVHTVNFRRSYLRYLEHDLPGADALRRRLLRKYPGLLKGVAEAADTTA